MLAAYGLLLAHRLAGAARSAGACARLQRWLAPRSSWLTAGWALAFSHGIYGQPHSRIQASDWIYANIPAGATLATEHWDDRLPLGRPGHDPRASTSYTELALYDPETPDKRAKLEGVLDQSQYVVMASRRLIGSIPRLPERYPMATTYYRLLESGQLGFERVGALSGRAAASARSAIDDSLAQEDFTVYDHPLVEVWQKRADYSSASDAPAARRRAARSRGPTCGRSTAARARCCRRRPSSRRRSTRARGASCSTATTWPTSCRCRSGCIAAELLALSAVPVAVARCCHS